MLTSFGTTAIGYDNVRFAHSEFRSSTGAPRAEIPRPRNSSGSCCSRPWNSKLGLAVATQEAQLLGVPSFSFRLREPGRVPAHRRRDIEAHLCLSRDTRHTGDLAEHPRIFRSPAPRGQPYRSLVRPAVAQSQYSQIYPARTVSPKHHAPILRIPDGPPTQSLRTSAHLQR